MSANVETEAGIKIEYIYSNIHNTLSEYLIKLNKAIKKYPKGIS